MEDKLLRLEEYSRKDNLVFQNIAEAGRDENCFEATHKIFNEIKLPKFQFQRCHRLGKYVRGNTRPIIAKFTNDDLPVEIGEKRAVLRPILS